MWPEDGGGRLDVTFVAGTGRRVGDGILHEGAVADDELGLVWNLHEPGVVRRIVDEVALGYRADGDSRALDGWAVMSASSARSAAG